MARLTAYRWNGEYWYRDEGQLRRAVKWVAWFGGWEAHSPKRPWTGVGGKHWTFRERFKMLTPVSLLGHRISIYGWGWSARNRRGSLVWTKRDRSLYFSHDGTPDGATIWFRGAPRHVRAAAEMHAQEVAERAAQLTALAKGTNHDH
jgi:hypothetical protein